MVHDAVAERFDVVSTMTEGEARACVSTINGHMNSARALLLDLYERRGWAALGYQSWHECVTAEFDQSQRYLYRQLQAAEIEQRIGPVGQIGAIPERQLRPLAALTPMEQPIAWQEANERTNGKITARIVDQVVKEMRADSVNDELDPPMELEQVADQFPDELTKTDKLLLRTTITNKPRVNAGLFTSATPEWYTPEHIIARVLKMFDEIDLDPCSNARGDAANVPAGDHYTIDDDGLSQRWHGRVYMNPPYGDEIGQWTARMIDAYDQQEIDEAIALVPARTDTAWFRPFKQRFLICLVDGRLKFSGAENSAPFPSAIVYIGPDRESFIKYFSDLGTIVERAA